MKKLILLVSIGIFTLSIRFSSITTVKANEITIGNYSDKEDYCPNAGSGCIHLRPIVIK